jgi:hypothetical protein
MELLSGHTHQNYTKSPTPNLKHIKLQKNPVLNMKPKIDDSDSEVEFPDDAQVQAICHNKF